MTPTQSSQSKRMTSSSSRTLILLAAYATVMTMTCSYYFIQNVSRELNERRSSVDEWDSYIYEEQFLPVNSEKIEGDGGVSSG
jgi:hypothetical protein